MRKIKTEKGVVKRMREIRDALSLEIMDMTFEQQRAYMDKMLAELRSKNGQKVEGAK